ncbi:MAG: hypothetical protein AB1782_15265 [Cyanobacteriota bacterium]
MLNCYSPVYSSEELRDYFINLSDDKLYGGLSEMENYYYGHDYETNTIKDRLSRLEKTVFKYKRHRLSYGQRFEDLYRLYKSKKTPFYSKTQHTETLSNSQMSLLCLMENRLFNGEKNDIPLEQRINDLEMAILGSSVPGTLDERFTYLSKNTPISIKGIKVSQNGVVVAAVKPDHKPVPIPESPYKRVYTPLEIDYDQESGDYFSYVAQNSSGEILRWKDFPVYVFINSNNPDEINISKLAISYWQSKVPLYQTSNYQTADILIDWASKGDYITVPIISRESQNKQIKILINMLGPKEEEPQKDLLVFLMHQMGHSIGLWGHSDDPKDIMFPIGKKGLNDINIKNKNTYFYQPVLFRVKKPIITQKDLNTLFRVYQNPTSIEKIVKLW